MKKWQVLLFLTGWAWPALATEAEPSFHGSEAFMDFRLAGFEMLDEYMIDLNSDELLDAVVVEKTASGIGLSAWKADQSGKYIFMSRVADSPASSVAVFRGIQIDKATQAFLLDVYEDCPDEADHRVKLITAGPTGLKKVFESGYRVTHPEQEAGRAARQLFDLGGEKVGLKIKPNNKGWPDLFVRHDPKLIAVTGQAGSKIWFVIGIRERVFKEEKGVYVEVRDRYLDYLSRLQPKEITATSHLPSSEAAWEAGSAGDRRLASAWVEGRPGSGIGESITILFENQAEIRLIRIVPGCAESKQSWMDHNRAKRISLLFEGGTMISVNRKGAEELDSKVAAQGDFDLPGLGFGVQTMVFFSQPIKSSWVKLTIEEVERGTSDQDETCISEISVHRAKLDSQGHK